jgi:ubiquitin C-terminal hydrolase
MLEFFRKLLGLRRINDGYITIIYPVKGEGVVVNDTLSGTVSQALQCNAPAVHSAGSAVDSTLGVEVDDWYVVDVGYQSDIQTAFYINPATGLPMTDDFVDAGGNVFGFSLDS